MKSSKQVGPALEALYALTDSESGKAFSEALRLPPARRDLLSLAHADPYVAGFYRSAAFGKGWLDPDQARTAAIFQDMVDKVTARRVAPALAGSEASRPPDQALESVKAP